MKLKNCIKEMNKKFQNERALDRLKTEIENLPQTQQETIMACISAAKCQTSKGVRYTRKFIYECILLKIKSRKAYKHLLKRKLLQLPSLSTISRYIKNMKSSFGFNNSLFTALKKKSENMLLEDRRGN